MIGVNKCRVCDPMWAASTYAPQIPIDYICQCGTSQKVRKVDDGYIIEYSYGGNPVVPVIGSTKPFDFYADNK